MSAQALPQRHRITVDEYQQMGAAGIFHEDDRVELIEGEIFDMAPIGSTHAGIVGRLSRALIRAVGDNAIGWTQNPIRLPKHSEPLPDFALLKPRADDYINALPEPGDVILLIEVADSSLDYDRNTKVPLYARFGIPEVWLIDLKARKIEVYREPSVDGYQSIRTAGAGERLEPRGLSGIQLDVTELLP